MDSKFINYFFTICFVIASHSTFGQSYIVNDKIHVNNIRMSFNNIGVGSHSPDGNPGLYWFISESDSADMVFVDGLVFGGKVNGEIRVTGSNYDSSMQPGNILSNGKAAEPNDSTFRIWKYRKDWENMPPGFERDRIENDLNNWPVNLGAPFEDINRDGNYTFGIDTPPQIGNEINWFVMNDLDSAKADDEYQSKPMGLEVQTQIFAFNESNFLDDVIFKKYKIVNKGNNIITDFQIGYWADFDIIDPFNDYVGCDSELSLGFGYNGTSDEYGMNVIPPAIGYMLLQGPIIESNGNDSAFINSEWVVGYKNQFMTSFTPIIKGLYYFFIDPPKPYNETWYNNIRGLLTVTGEEVVNPNANIETFFPYNGNPETNEGWLDGDIAPPGDRRLIVNTGPFTIAPGDSQEVVYAILVAQGENNLNSVTKLKEKASLVRDFYNENLYPTSIERGKSIPLQYSISQNYPNPFNPTTNIIYSIPQAGETKIIIYDILGREVQTLVNEFKQPGKYLIKFDAGHLASGVYFYTLLVNDFIETKKMLLIK